MSTSASNLATKAKNVFLKKGSGPKRKEGGTSGSEMFGAKGSKGSKGKFNSSLFKLYL
jgi:hypothetical protein